MRSRVPGAPSSPSAAERPPIDPARADAIRREIRNLNLLSFAFAIPGIAMQAYGRVAFTQNPAGDWDPQKLMAMCVLVLLGAGLVIAGLCCYARMKGRSAGWGAMGLLSIIGLIVLNFIDRKCRNCGRENGANAKTCKACLGPI